MTLRPLLPLAAAALLPAVAACDTSTSSEPAGDAVTLSPDAFSLPEAVVSDTSTGGGGADAAPVGPLPNNVPCSLDRRVGRVEVAHRPFDQAPAYASVTAEVAAGVVPLTVLQPGLSLGDCQLMTKENPFCDPGCGAGELCDHDGSCIAYPVPESIGGLTVTGVVGGPVELAANAAAFYNLPSPPFPLFEAGVSIAVSAPGDALEGFELHGRGVPDLIVGEDVVFALRPGSPLGIAWEGEPAGPDGGESPWRVHFTINIDQHGITPATLFCTVPDTGSLEVPAGLIDALLAAGVSGFATAELTRRTVDSVDTAQGCVELQVLSNHSLLVDVEGHTPCFSDLQCPEGEVCDVPVNTCVPAGG